MDTVQYSPVRGWAVLILLAVLAAAGSVPAQQACTHAFAFFAGACDGRGAADGPTDECGAFRITDKSGARG